MFGQWFLVRTTPRVTSNMRKSNYIIFALLLTTLNSFGCSCFGTETVKQAFRTSDVVIYGEVISIGKHNLIQDLHYGDTIEWFTNKVTIRVATNLKNGSTEFVTVFTGIGDGDCGFNFQIGKSYLVYANNETQDEEKLLRTNICTRTTEATSDFEELKTLKKLAKLK